MDNMQLWLSSSTDSINLNDRLEGFYLNPDLDGLTGLPEIRSVNGLNAGYDGGWTATQLWAARLITIRGVIAINDKAAVETKRKALAKLLSQGKNEDLELKFVSEAGNTYTATVRTTNCTMALQRVFWRQEYQIQLRANDPLIYDDGGSELVAILRVMSGEGGFEIPFDIPFDIGGTVTPTSVDVGDEATYPLIRLKGDLHNPTIISLTTNQRMQVLADIITTTEWHDYATAYTTNGYMQINSTEEGAPLSLTHLYGNAEQKTLSGKNLLGVEGHLKASSNGIVPAYSEDGTISWSGTSTSAWANLTNDYAVNLPAGTYTFSIDHTLSHRIYLYYKFADNTGGYWIIEPNTLKSTTTFAQSITSLRLDLSGLTNGQSYNESVKAMVESGSTATSFEPYVGGTASPNPDYPQEIKTVTGAQTVQVTGKNLFDFSKLQKGSVTITDDVATGTASQFHSAWNGTSGFIDTYPDGRIAISAEAYTDGNDTTASTIGLRICINYTDGTRDFATWHNNDLAFVKQSVVSNQSKTISNIVFTYNASAQNIWHVRRLQIELGSTATAFEPYQGQSQEINLGKNLLDFSDFEMGGLSATGGIQPSTFRVQNRNNMIAVLPNTAYTLSTVLPETVKGMRAGWQEFDASGTFIIDRGWQQLAGAPKTFTTTANTHYIAFVLSLSTTSSTVTTGTTEDTTACSSPTEWARGSQFQLEAGARATSYSAYKTPIELAKIPNTNYTNSFRIIDGKWYIHKEVGKVVYTGAQSESWVMNLVPGYGYRARIELNDNYVGTGRQTIFSDYFHSDSEQPTAHYVGLGYTSANYLYLYQDINIITDADFKTWLSTHNTTVYYALATPTDTEITDSELIEQLNHIYSLYQGQNNLWLIGTGAQGEMTVTYATAVDRDHHEVVIDCQARTVTQDGQNLYPSLADGSEFIRLLPGENRLYLTSEVESDDGTAEVKFKKGNISI